MNAKKDMPLWHNDFIKVCNSNFLLFTSLYMYVPVLPSYWVSQFNISFEQAGFAFGVFLLSLFAVGPFLGYLIDFYKKKNLCLIAFLILLFSFGGFLLTNNFKLHIFFRFLQGGAFSLAFSMLNTLSINITSSPRRNEGELVLNWSSFLGIITGVLLGLLIYKNENINYIFYISSGLIVLAFLLISTIRIIFHAPIGVKMFSLDRFILPKAILPAINFTLISFAFGLLIVSISAFTIMDFLPIRNTCLILLAMGIGLFFVILFTKSYPFKGHSQIRASMGLIIMLLSVILLKTHSDFFILFASGLIWGIGFGFTISGFQNAIINLSEHCQRGTANMMFFLSFELGLILGVIMGTILLNLTARIEEFSLILVILVIAFLISIIPFYLKKEKNRMNK